MVSFSFVVAIVAPVSASTGVVPVVSFSFVVAVVALLPAPESAPVALRSARY